MDGTTPTGDANPNPIPPTGGFNTPHDPVNHPTHYASDAKCSGCGESIEAIDVVRHLSFNIGNAMKYLWRAGKKDDLVQDLEKAVWYIEDQIAMIKGEKNPKVHRLSEEQQAIIDRNVSALNEEFERSSEITKCEFATPSYWISGRYLFTCSTHHRSITVDEDLAPDRCSEVEE